MMELIDIGIDNAIAFRIEGKISEPDMALVLSVMKGKIRAHGEIVLFEQIDSFGGVELAGIVDKFKYLFEMGIRDIGKIAIVTDKKWVAKFIAIEDKIFKSFQIRCFPIEEREQAIAFLRS